LPAGENQAFIDGCHWAHRSGSVFFRKRKSRAGQREGLLCFIASDISLGRQAELSERPALFHWGRNRNTRLFTSVVPKNMGFFDACVEGGGNPEDGIFLVDFWDKVACYSSRKEGFFARMASARRSAAIWPPRLPRCERDIVFLFAFGADFPRYKAVRPSHYPRFPPFKKS